MQITDIRATLRRYPSAPDQQHVSAFGRLTTFDMTLVAVINGDMKSDRKRYAFLQKVVKKPQI